MAQFKRVLAAQWRAGLDVLATILLITVCTVLLWALVAGRPLDTPTQARAYRPTTAPPAAFVKLPSEPLSIEGAQTIGNKNAAVVVIEFSDFQCPYCGRFARDAFPAFKKSLIDTGKVQLVFRSMPLESIHPFALSAAVSAECAGRQGKFWAMHDALFGDQKNLDDPSLAKRAKAVGLDEVAFQRCMIGDAIETVRASGRAAEPLGVNGTPTFFFGTRTKDGRVKLQQRLAGVLTKEQLEGAVARIMVPNEKK